MTIAICAGIFAVMFLGFGVAALRSSEGVTWRGKPATEEQATIAGVLFLLVGVIALIVTAVQMWDLVFGTEVVESRTGQLVGGALRWWEILYGVGEILVFAVWVLGAIALILFEKGDRAVGVFLLVFFAVGLTLSNLLGRVFLDRNDVPFDPIVDLWRGVFG